MNTPTLDEKSFTIANFLSDNELESINKLSNAIPNSKNKGHFKAYTNGFDYELLPKSIRNKIKDCIGEQDPTISMILKETQPWGIHTDFQKEGETTSPTWALLIPIDYSGKTHTVIFNEESDENYLSDYKKTHPKKTYSYTDEQLDLLAHCDHEDLDWVTNPKFYRWQRGDLIAWRRSLWHSSDNFKKDEHDYKTALVLFFCEPKAQDG